MLCIEYSFLEIELDLRQSIALEDFNFKNFNIKEFNFKDI